MKKIDLKSFSLEDLETYKTNKAILGILKGFNYLTTTVAKEENKKTKEISVISMTEVTAKIGELENINKSLEDKYHETTN